MDFKDFILTEMPHGLLDDDTPIDFKMEKPQWNKRLVYFINRTHKAEELLRPFYVMSYGLMLKKKFSQLSDSDKEELLKVLPKQFILDMELI